MAVWGNLHSVGEPRGKERRSNTNEVVEDRHTNSEKEGQTVAKDNEGDPDTPAGDGVAVEMLRVAENADKDDLGGGVGIERASEEEVGDGDAVRDLLPVDGERGEGRRRDDAANVTVGDTGKDGVKDGGEGLESVGGLHGVARLLHFGDEDEEPTSESSALETNCNV